MRERDLKALEFDKMIALVTAMAVSEPGQRAVAESHPSTDPAEVRDALRPPPSWSNLRAHSGSLPIDEFDDQRSFLLVAAPEGAVLNGETLVNVRDFVVAARTAEAFLRSRVESRPHLAAIVQNLVAPKELADALLSALADDGGLLDDASRELKRLRTRLRDERLELETRLARSLNAGDGALRLRLPGDGAQSAFRPAAQAQLRRAPAGYRAGSFGLGRDALRRTDVGGRTQQPPDDARARGRSRRISAADAADARWCEATCRSCA